MAGEDMERMNGTGSKRSLDRHDKMGRRQGAILVYFCAYAHF
ncbi:MAG: hypothetical protein P8105_11095 [Dehalococcoidia bacterium]